MQFFSLNFFFFGSQSLCEVMSMCLGPWIPFVCVFFVCLFRLTGIELNFAIFRFWLSSIWRRMCTKRTWTLVTWLECYRNGTVPNMVNWIARSNFSSKENWPKILLGRRKMAPFRQLVEQAYKTVLHSYGLDSNPSSDDNEESDLEFTDVSGRGSLFPIFCFVSFSTPSLSLSQWKCRTAVAIKWSVIC